MKVVNSNRFYLKGTQSRFLHLATVENGSREFMCFQDLLTQNTYIEEITGGTLQFIQDDSLAFELAKFLEYSKITTISKPTLPDSVWKPLNEKRKIF